VATPTLFLIAGTVSLAPARPFLELHGSPADAIPLNSSQPLRLTRIRAPDSIVNPNRRSGLQGVEHALASPLSKHLVRPRFANGTHAEGRRDGCGCHRPGFGGFGSSGAQEEAAQQLPLSLPARRRDSRFYESIIRDLEIWTRIWPCLRRTMLRRSWFQGRGHSRSRELDARLAAHERDTGSNPMPSALLWLSSRAWIAEPF